MGEQSALAELIRKARLRHASHLILHQTIFASAIALGGLIVLLLLGTQVLDARWLAAVFVISLAVGLYRIRTRLLTPYQLAQILDGKLALQDRLSTAQYFSEHPERGRPAQELVEKQRATANDAARGIDLATGLPFTVPKSLYVGGAFAIIAASVFAVRYGVTHSLDLRPSLVNIAFNGLLDAQQIADAKKKGLPLKPGDERPTEPSLTVDPWESKALDAQGAPDNALNTVDTPDPNNPNYNTDANAKADGMKSQDPVQQPGDSAENGDKSSGADQQADNNSSSKDGGKPGKDKPGEQQDKQGSNSGGENSSLADKMRDAISNLMSKLKSQPKNEGNQNPSQTQEGKQSAQKQGNEKGSPQQGKSQDAASSPDNQGDQEGQSSDKSASAQSKSGSKSSDKPPSQDGKSGVGKEDGDKSAREAAQLAAMGKISEIIGKRQANMTGEVMVEVGSGKQQLKTQYSSKSASHTDAGGEINRDEVPLAYQQFVQQYFEEIRKIPASPTPSKAKKSPGT